MQKHTEKPAPEAHLATFERPADHSVSIGILTYKRPAGLETCVRSVRRRLETPLPAPWTMAEIVVVDNDPAGSARQVVESLRQSSVQPPVPIRYISESRPGIAAARARAMTETVTQVLVFIDDDEVAEEGWPHGLLSLMHDTGAAMVGGPVVSKFVEPPPTWIVDGRFFDRENPPHGSSQEWLRSGNLAIDLRQTDAAAITFDPRFLHGEDSAFSRRAKASGLELRWSAYGAITEFVGPGRFDVGWRLRREYLGHRAWTRSSLDMASGGVAKTKARLRVIAASGARVVTALVHVAKAVGRFSKAEAVMAAVDVIGAAGNLVEVVTYHKPRSRHDP